MIPESQLRSVHSVPLCTPGDAIREPIGDPLTSLGDEQAKGNSTLTEDGPWLSTTGGVRDGFTRLAQLRSMDENFPHA